MNPNTTWNVEGDEIPSKATAVVNIMMSGIKTQYITLRILLKLASIVCCPRFDMRIVLRLCVDVHTNDCQNKRGKSNDNTCGNLCWISIAKIRCSTIKCLAVFCLDAIEFKTDNHVCSFLLLRLTKVNLNLSGIVILHYVIVL